MSSIVKSERGASFVGFGVFLPGVFIRLRPLVRAMPQPLSRVKPTANVFIGNSDSNPSDHRPALALLAMKVLAEWSILESFLSALFLKMLGANPAPAAAIYQAVHAAQARDAALRALANIALSEEENDIFEAILSVLATAVKPRNDIAHWIWGYSPDLPDGVLLIDPEIMMRWRVAFEEHTGSIRTKSETPTPEFPRESTFVYYERDFVNASKDIQRAIHLLTAFRFLLMRDHPANLDDRQREELLQQPEIQKVVSQRIERRQKMKEAQQ